MTPWIWIRSVSAALWGELDIDNYREALQLGAQYKGHMEMLHRALAEQTHRADLAARLLDDAQKGQRVASDALGQRLIAEMKAKP